LKEQFKGMIRKNLQTGSQVSELCDAGNVILQSGSEITGDERKKEASVETPA
jgi:hypothetical protein